MEASRKEALKKGHTQYFSGVQCVKGHVSARRAKTGECLECRKCALVIWRKNNKEAVRQHNAVQYKKYPELKAEWALRNKKYARTHKAKINAKTRAYQVSKINRTPKWIDNEEAWLINEIYELAIKRTEVTGYKWHVDHIIPLRGNNVSGLHTADNLQVILAVDNVRKSNRYVV
jgi:hypothetical protein